MDALEKLLGHEIPLDDAADYFVRLKGTKTAGVDMMKAAWDSFTPEEKAEVLAEAGVDEAAVKEAMEKKEHKAPVSHRVGEFVGKHHDKIRGVEGALLGLGAGAKAVQHMGAGPGKSLLALGAGGGGGYLAGRAAGRFEQGEQAGMAHAHREKKAEEATVLPPTAKGQNMQATPPVALPASAMGQQKMGSDKDPKEVGKERARASLSAEYEKHKSSKGENAFKNVGTAVGALAGGQAAKHLGKGKGAVTAAGALIGAGIGRSVGKDTGTSLDAHRFKKQAEKFKRALAGMTTPSGPEVPEMDEYIQNELAGQEAEQGNQSQYFQQRFQQASQELQQTQQMAQQAQQQADELQVQVADSQAQIQAAMQQAQMASQGAMANVQNAHQMAMDATSQAMESQAEVLRQKQLAAAMRMGVQTLKDNVMGAMANDPTDQLAQQLTAPPPGSAGPVGGDPMAAQQPQVGPDGQPLPPGTPGADPAAAGGPPEAAAPPGGAPAEGGPPKKKPEGEKSESKDKKPDEKKDKGGGTTKVEVKHAAQKFAGFSLPHAAAGAVLGGSMGAGYSQMSNDKLRMQAGQQATGFSKAMDVAQAKIRLAMGEVAENHPIAATLTGALAGGLEGGLHGQEMMGGLRQAGSNIKDIASNIGKRVSG